MSGNAGRVADATGNWVDGLAPAFARPTDTIFGRLLPYDDLTWDIGYGNTWIFVGQPCLPSDAGGTGSCLAIPPGVQRLKDDLKALAAAMAAQPACADL